MLTPLNKPVEIRMLVTQEQAFAMKRIALGVDRLSYLVTESGALLSAMMARLGVEELVLTDAALEAVADKIPRLMREPRDEKSGGGVRLFFAKEMPDAEPAGASGRAAGQG